MILIVKLSPLLYYLLQCYWFRFLYNTYKHLSSYNEVTLLWDEQMQFTKNTVSIYMRH